MIKIQSIHTEYCFFSFSSSGDLYNEAAEAAMAGMKGRLANKYYMLAEECYGEVEEEEEEDSNE